VRHTNQWEHGIFDRQERVVYALNDDGVIVAIGYAKLFAEFFLINVKKVTMNGRGMLLALAVFGMPIQSNQKIPKNWRKGALKQRGFFHWLGWDLVLPALEFYLKRAQRMH
jgi:hypothetical protein